MMPNQPRILIVEDDTDAQQVTQHILEYLAIAVDVAADAESAEHLLFDLPSSFYDVAIIDLALPGKNGWQLLHEIQDSQATAHIKCVAMTAFHRSLMRERALEAGFIAYFAKPINPPAFAELIGHMVHGKS